ncbi:putative DUF3068 family protein [Corynebacterium mustelae]|uniref:Putative DUF3068 family protein n=1 Tax=Corynebacterium mustelae TaxID=571915 RepID=A0A0G3GUA1_9CORY|nr:DUF3068 domain-containing protein [Corynebacterium mustelae]AKK04741.1 putative DUF3068 family protein [Corynebacterium mustelae]
MLPKTRIASAIIIGLGFALIAWGVVFPYVVPVDARMPLALTQTTVTLVDDSATQRMPGDGSTYTGPMTKQYHAEILPPVDSDLATARVGVSLLRGAPGIQVPEEQSDLDRLVEASVWTYSFARTTGLNTSPLKFVDVPATPPQTVEFSGYWVKFPSNAEQTTYEVFDSTLRRTTPAVFQEAIQRGGRTIYRYHQEIEPTNVARNYRNFFTTIPIEIPAEFVGPHQEEIQPGEELTPDGLQPPADGAEPPATGGENLPEENAEQPGGPEMKTVAADLYHSGTRDFYVDQISGMVIDVDEDIIDYYGDEQGGKLADAHLFSGSVSDEQAAALLAQASQISDGSVVRTINWVVFGIGCLLTLIGLAGAFRIRRRQRKANEIQEMME